jgi:hypothetical protein
VRVEHHRRVAKPARELVDQARFAEAGRAEQHRESGGGSFRRLFIYRLDTRQLGTAAHERKRGDAHRALERHDAVRLHGFGAPFQGEAAERRERDERGNQSLRRLTDHDVAVASLLLQPCRDVDGVPDDLGVFASHHLAGIHRDAQTGLSDHAALLLGQLAKRLLHRDRGAHGANRIVLRHARCTENCRDAVTEKLDDGPVVGLDDGTHRVVVTLHEAACGFRIEALVQRGGPDQIGEHDGDDLACAGRVGRARSRGRAALVAELRRGAELGVTARAQALERCGAFLAKLSAGAVVVSAGITGHATALGRTSGAWAALAARKRSLKRPTRNTSAQSRPARGLSPGRYQLRH